jgi:tryptophan halogenase
LNHQVRNIVIVGGGSAGYMTALACKTRLPTVQVEVISSPDIPVIGVGESTTPAMPRFLHDDLRIDRGEFFRDVEPSWKLGLRLEFGVADVPCFYYPFDVQLNRRVPGSQVSVGYHMLADPVDASFFTALMERHKAPCSFRNGQWMIDARSAYHIKNERFIPFMRRKSVEAGCVDTLGEVANIARDEQGHVTSLKLTDGRDVAADFFIDCTGYRSLLLAKTLGERFVSYGASLFCDTAIVGEWQRSDEIRPYTTCTTMNNGWCWRIDFHDFVTRGYVHCSAFCSADEAMQEMKAKNPELGDNLRVLKFPSGRYENFWVGNVAAIGNSSGFVEPLEATALHVAIEQIHFLLSALQDGGLSIVPAMRHLENVRFRRIWDDVRDFLSLHYRFNRQLDTPFWRHCQANVDLAGAAPVVEYYRHAGPTGLIAGLLDPMSIFNFNGYLSILLGQRVATAAPPPAAPADVQAWTAIRDRIRAEAIAAPSVRDALMPLIHGGAVAG